MRKNKAYYIDESSIHGKGIFANQNLNKNTPVGQGIAYNFGFIPYVTKSPGSLINHSYKPNTYLKWNEKKNGWWIVTSRSVKQGSELTLDYRKTPWYIQGPLPHYK